MSVLYFVAAGITALGTIGVIVGDEFSSVSRLWITALNVCYLVLFIYAGFHL